MGNWNQKLGALALASLMLAAPALRAEDMSADDAMEELRSTLGGLSAEVNNIGKTVKDTIKFSGDFRYRYEKIDSLQPGGQVDRERYRIRLRLNADAKVNDFTKVKFRLATGTLGVGGSNLYSDPVSTNQTLQDSGDNKAFLLDIAEMDFEPKGMILSPKAQFGKMSNPFKEPEGEMIFDGDLTPEGIALTLKQELGMGAELTVAGAQFINGDVSSGAFQTLDPKFEGGQVILGWSSFVELKLAGGYYHWFNLLNATPATQYSQNTNTAGFNDFDVVDSYASVGVDLMGIPTEAYYQYEKNSDVTDDNDGYIAGITVSSGKLIPMAKDWLKVNYNYREQKKDATFSPWNFSDFAGGKTDASGSMVSGKIKLFDGTDMGLTYFSNKIGLKSQAYLPYERWQWDLAVKF